MVMNTKLSENAKRDYKIVLKALEGDQKSYAKLLNRYKSPIFFMLLKMLNNSDDAEDLTLEAFGKAFKNLQKYSPEYAFSTWLFKIATNNCIDFLRKKRTKFVSLEKFDENGKAYEYPIEDKGLTPEEAFIKNQKAEILRTILKTLKPRYKEIIELRYFKEYSYIEIADTLNLPIGTIKAQLFRSKELLSNILKDRGENL